MKNPFRRILSLFRIRQGRRHIGSLSEYLQKDCGVPGWLDLLDEDESDKPKISVMEPEKLTGK